MQRSVTLFEKISWAILFAMGIYFLYKGSMAIVEGHVYGGKASHGHPAYFSKDPFMYLFMTGLYLFMGAGLVRFGWGGFLGDIRQATPDPVHVPLWLKLGAQVSHSVYGIGTVLRLDQNKHVTIAFQHHGNKTLELGVALSLIKPSLVP